MAKMGGSKRKRGKKGRGGKKESANTARMQSLTTAVELTSRCNFHWLGGDARPWKTLKLRGQPRRMRFFPRKSISRPIIILRGKGTNDNSTFAGHLHIVAFASEFSSQIAAHR